MTSLVSTEVTSFANATSPESVEWNESLHGDYYYPAIKQPLHMIILYSVAYSMVFFVGIIGNSLVVAVVYRNAQMHNATNYFIVNLAIADMLVLTFCLPFTLLQNLISGWPFGAAMCKLIPYMQGISVNASVNTMAALAFDRYLAICHVLHFRMTRRVARLVIASIWTLAGVLLIPWLFAYEQRLFRTPLQSLNVCSQFWSSDVLRNTYFVGVVFLFCFAVPLSLITVFYALISWRVWHRNAPGIANASKVILESKVKVLKMLIVVVALFAAFWIPLYGVNIRIYLGPNMADSDTEFYVISQIIVPICQWLGSSNSCINPIIYCLFSRKFRSGFADLAASNCRRRGSRSGREFGLEMCTNNPTKRSFYNSTYGSIVTSRTRMEVEGEGGREWRGVTTATYVTERERRGKGRESNGGKGEGGKEEGGERGCQSRFYFARKGINTNFALVVRNGAMNGGNGSVDV